MVFKDPHVITTVPGSRLLYLRRLVMLLGDVACLLIAVLSSFVLNHSNMLVPSLAEWMWMITALLLAFPILFQCRLYHSLVFNHIEDEFFSIFKGMCVATVLWVLVTVALHIDLMFAVSYSFFLNFWLLGILMMVASRLIFRRFKFLSLYEDRQGIAVLIYGEGSTHSKKLDLFCKSQNLYPVGFLVDDGAELPTNIGLPVYTFADLPNLVKHSQIEDVLLYFPAMSYKCRQNVLSSLKRLHIHIHVFPGLGVLTEQAVVQQVCDMDSLLGRPQVAPHPELLKQCIAKRVVLVTGAGGSIGFELCQQIASIGPTMLVLLEISESALYQVERSLRAFDSFAVSAYLGSVEDVDLVTELLVTCGVQTIFHAAAFKHVPLVEDNVLVGVRNNVLGTWCLAEAAFHEKVENFVLISSDKAVRPTSVMGASKRWSEYVIDHFAQLAEDAQSRQRFCAVRFGNVLGSSGSVVPLFKEQVMQGGPVTLTHEDVVRYFMTIQESVSLVIQASSMAQGGEVFLLDMGKPIKIHDLARYIIHSSGYTVQDSSYPQGDIKIIITGLRHGEKLHEELFVNHLRVRGTAHPHIKTAIEPRSCNEVMCELIKTLQDALHQRDVAKVRDILRYALQGDMNFSKSKV